MTSYSVLVCVCFCVLLVLLLLLLLVVCIVRLTISAAKISSLQNRTRTRTYTTTRQLFSRSRLRQENCDDHQNLRSNDQTTSWSKLRYEERASLYPAARKRDFVLVMRFPNPLSNFITIQRERVVRLFDHQKDRREEKEERRQLFVPPSLFLLVAFEDECKDRTRVLTRYVRV